MCKKFGLLYFVQLRQGNIHRFVQKPEVQKNTQPYGFEYRSKNLCFSYTYFHQDVYLSYCNVLSFNRVTLSLLFTRAPIDSYLCFPFQISSLWSLFRKKPIFSSNGKVKTFWMASRESRLFSIRTIEHLDTNFIFPSFRTLETFQVFILQNFPRCTRIVLWISLSPLSIHCLLLWETFIVWSSCQIILF